MQVVPSPLWYTTSQWVSHTPVSLCHRWWLILLFFSNVVCHLLPCRLVLPSAPSSRSELLAQNVTVYSGLSTAQITLWLPRWHVLAHQLAGPGASAWDKNFLPHNGTGKTVTLEAACCAASAVESCGGWEGEPASVHSHIPLLRQWWPTKLLWMD